ncbi:MAG: leucine-rich repeat domain-containing protein [Erysipelotrichaceae bacterium]|nr:leucine-rich repeat domain-containing protein [Erysipelotrichaceae bacterium]
MEKYKGNKEPYVYALFTQNDRERALEVLEYLSGKNYRLTYEENRAKDCINRSSAVMLFLSSDALNDEKLLKEVSIASKLNKTIISIFLEETKLTPGLSMMLGQTQGIMKYQLDDEQFKEKLDNSPALAHMEVSEQQKAAGKKQSLMMTIGIGALAVIAAVLLFLKPFSSSSALLQQLGISGNLKDIKNIYVYGEDVRDEYDIPQFILTDDGLNDLILINNYTTDIGTIEDISDFSKITNLEELCISGNSIRTIEPILSLKKLRLLDISHNYGIDISGISALENLEILNIAETEIEDISELKQLKNLKTLYVSSDYFSMQKEMLAQLSAEVKSIDQPVYSFEEMKAALNNSDIHSVRIMNSIVIPEGETITVNKGVLLRGNSLGENSNIIVDNYGSMIIYGGFEMGLCRRNNYGTIIIKDGGAYTGGMCDSYTYGSFIIEKGGMQIHERGHSFMIDSGTYRNDGTLVFGGGGDFHFNDGEFINNGVIVWNLGNYGPGIYLNSSNYTNNGKVYLKDNRGKEDNMSSYDIDENCIEIAMDTINSYNAQ